VSAVVMALEVTSSIASSGMYKKKELINNFYNGSVRCKWGNKAGNLNIMVAEREGVVILL
jgi:uncharacterized protein YodC (DUF2158 family)